MSLATQIADYRGFLIEIAASRQAVAIKLGDRVIDSISLPPETATAAALRAGQIHLDRKILRIP